MKIKRINAAFFQGLKFNAYRKTTAQLNEDALNLAYKVLFGEQGFRYITKEEATRVNQLLKICEHILNRYCVADAPNINNITVFLYLSKAINEFYRERSAGTDFLESQRNREHLKEKQQRRTIHMSEICRDWVPKPTKTYLRGALYETFGAYPEQLYAALTFYLVKEFYPDLTGAASRQIKQILYLINRETTVRHAQKGRGAESHSGTDIEELYKWTKDALKQGKFAKCNGRIDLSAEIETQLYVGRPLASLFIKRIQRDFPESPVLKRKKKTKL